MAVDVKTLRIESFHITKLMLHRWLYNKTYNIALDLGKYFVSLQ